MNFFKSVFSDDPDPLQPESQPESNNADPIPDSAGADDTWNFGGLIKTLTAKSESIIETYRRDLQEFSTGLKNEIEVAQDSVGEIGSTVIKGTAQIISQGKEAILAVNLDSDNATATTTATANRDSNSLDSKRYSRFDAQISAIQSDVGTYTEVPEDLGEFNEWKLGFVLDGKSDEMESLFRENDVMESVYKRIVPNSIDHETFWYRYYYKVYRLKKAEDVRAKLVRRISKDEEDLSWDVEDEDDDDDSVAEKEKKHEGENLGKSVDTDLNIGASSSGSSDEKRLSVEEVKHSESKEEERDDSMQTNELGNEMGKSVDELRVEVVNETGGGNEDTGVDKTLKSVVVDGAVSASKDVSVGESDETVIEVERNAADVKSSSSKNNESSVVENQHIENEEEDDLGWDDIEDLSSIDDNKATQSQSQSGSISKDDLRKRLSTAEEDEDLSWDIEDDDDEPVKA
ncbi:BSD domain-containing protein 1-A-like [Trifolium pratense]|uniref:BSD domain-containing protein 1-A-like n=1 Tax=Trifolium pratense TaxID=57577 RepID=UPI001E690B00|nr:BSD domain-containing protein 1-A-like [Trifolium pratense]